MIYIINTILLILCIICASLPLAYCLAYLYDLAINRQSMTRNDNIIFGFCATYFLACSFVIFRVLGFG